MTQEERRRFLIDRLLRERPDCRDVTIPSDEGEQRNLLRALMNLRPPGSAEEEFLRVQDDYLRRTIEEKGITDLADLMPAEGDLYLWQGDITLLKADAIVNAANSGMTGCYHPLHNCIDNCIHTYAGVQLRRRCGEIMRQQGHEEPTGQAKITPAYNLPSRYVIHTVGPIVQGPLNAKHKEQLASCYRACLALAEENACESIAFCCISTGVFGFPKAEAARIAVDVVRQHKAETGSGIKVVFNVFTDEDLSIYRAILEMK